MKLIVSCSCECLMARGKLTLKYEVLFDLWAQPCLPSQLEKSHI